MSFFYNTTDKGHYIRLGLELQIKYLDTLITLHVTTEKLASVFPYKIEVLLVSLYFRARVLNFLDLLIQYQTSNAIPSFGRGLGQASLSELYTGIVSVTSRSAITLFFRWLSTRQVSPSRVRPVPGGTRVLESDHWNKYPM